MKFLWIFCNESIAPEVIELLEEIEIDGYTVWQNVRGHHRGCKTHWGDEVWPGTNWAFLAIEEIEGKAWHLLEELKKLKKRPEVRRAGLRAYVQNCDEKV
ncbi:MAG TPA: hypothetical protein PLS21_03605 [Synergistales bacterium]|jgi:hypothetical protein|nr:hypothetical protein [Synergistaceae bacterium]HPA58654.1 hypothetical protein [Synergistales bacterium]HQO83063.1 hypothetical protein [Synergistales bacterium]HQQ10614.1 hypothetical protein [Synergistales bacterium]